jgi:hypothetical protein
VAPCLAHAAAGTSTTPPHLTLVVATIVARAVVVAAATEQTRLLPIASRLRAREREDAQTKDELTPRTQGEHEKIRTKWTATAPVA